MRKHNPSESELIADGSEVQTGGKVSKNHVKIAGVEIAKQSGSHDFVPPINDAYHFPEFSSDVVRDINENRKVMLTGHTGCGKTSLFQQIGAQANQPVVRCNLNGQTTIGDFVGLWTVKGGETVWVDGVLPQAMREGHWLILDEIDFAEAAILSVLNSVLEKNGTLTLKEKGHELVHPHENFRLFATANTAGVMADFRGLYQGTNILNEAFMDRWKVYHVDYLPPEKEAEVIAKTVDRMTLKITPMIVKVVNMVREAFKKEEIQCTFSLRRAIDWAEMMVRHKDPMKAAESTIFAKVSREDGEVIKGIIQRVMSVKKNK